MNKEIEFNIYSLGFYIYKIKFIILTFLVIGFFVGSFLAEDPKENRQGQFQFDIINSDIKELNDYINIVLTNNLFKRLNRETAKFPSIEARDDFEIFSANIDEIFLVDTISQKIYSRQLKLITAKQVSDRLNYDDSLETLNSIFYEYKTKETSKLEYITYVKLYLKTNLSEEDFRYLIQTYFYNLSNEISNHILIRINFLIDKSQMYNIKIKEYFELQIDSQAKMIINDNETIEAARLLRSKYEIEKIIDKLDKNKDSILSSIRNQLENKTIIIISSNSLSVDYSISYIKDKSTLLISLIISLLLSLIFGYLYLKLFKKIF